MSAPLGILGGTFDPVHNAHLRLGLEAIETLGLASIRWVPSGSPGHREAPHASGEHRLAMLRLALAGYERFTIDEAELQSAAPTYTVNTLARLRAELGEAVSLALIIGADHLLALERWHDWRRLFELAHLAVAQRPGYAISASAMAAGVAQEYGRRSASARELAGRPAGLIVVFPMTPLDFSATSIREVIAAGNSPRDWVPPSVLEYIGSKGLYRKNVP